MRQTGAVYTTEKDITDQQVLSNLYDAIVFIDKTTRARPIQ
jgi:erythromycin esterase-like protein